MIQKRFNALRRGTGNAYVALAAMVCAALSSAGAAEWTLTVEKDGTTNVVTAADGRKYAIDVSFAEKDGGWSGRIVNREKGAVVLGFEVKADPQEVIEGKSALYLPHVYGRRIRAGARLPPRRVSRSWIPSDSTRV